MKTSRNDHRTGFTLVEIMIVVAIIGLLAAVAIPNFMHARQNSVKDFCVANLRQIDAAKAQWALETGQTSAATPDPSQLTPYIGHGSGVFPTCPLSPGGSPAYNINTVGAPPTCPNFDTNSHLASLN
jgi:prepilin-type N-terminal cleavage/methylation domain-containing protein